MKKVFSAITILIALSLLGIIIIQVNWFSNLLLVQEDKFLFKVDRAAVAVTSELGKQASSSIMSLRVRPNLQQIPDDLSLGFFRPPTISERYTTRDIYNKLRTAFDSQGLKDLQFEFAITVNSDQPIVEMQSKKFCCRIPRQWSLPPRNYSHYARNGKRYGRADGL